VRAASLLGVSQDLPCQVKNVEKVRDVIRRLPNWFWDSTAAHLRYSYIREFKGLNEKRSKAQKDSG
jgi:hypothetical protein